MNRISLLSILIVVLFAATQVSASTKFPQALIDAMATREMRYHHFIWHNIRNLWNKLDNNTKAAITKLGWAPPRPALRYDVNGTSYTLEDNGSGEDFLYMHRQMIAKANAIIKANKSSYGNLTSWTTIPSASSTSYPLSAAYVIPNNTGLTDEVSYRKSNDSYNRIKAIEANLTNPAILRNMTLGQLGSRIEFTIHSWLHMRFSNVSNLGYRKKGSNPVPNVDTKWDNVTYDWLGDTYSAHVNPLFWKVHGWVDDRIEGWRRANNIKTIKWNGTWVGGNISRVPDLIQSTNQSRLLVHAMHAANASNTTANNTTTATDEHASMGNMDNMDADGSCLDSMDMSVMEEVMKVLLGCGVDESNFYDHINSKYAPNESSFSVSKTHKTTTTVKKSFRG